MSAMKRLFQIMADKKASDIFLSVGSPINIKINGVAMPVNQAIMTGDTIKQLLYEEGFTIAGAKKRLEAELAGRADTPSSLAAIPVPFSSKKAA